MKVYPITKEMEKKLKEGYKNNRTDIDPLLLPWLDKINNYDGIATIMSCQGHPEKKYLPNQNQYGTLFITAIEKHFDNLARIINELGISSHVSTTDYTQKDESYENKIFYGNKVSMITTTFHHYDLDIFFKWLDACLYYYMNTNHVPLLATKALLVSETNSDIMRYAGIIASETPLYLPLNITNELLKNYGVDGFIPEEIKSRLRCL